MKAKIVRPHMGVKTGDRFVGQVKWLMSEHNISRDDAINLMVHQSNNVEQVSTLWFEGINRARRNTKMQKAYFESTTGLLRQENRKLYMIIVILSVACISLAVL